MFKPEEYLASLEAAGYMLRAKRQHLEHSEREFAQTIDLIAKMQQSFPRLSGVIRFDGGKFDILLPSLSTEDAEFLWDLLTRHSVVTTVLQRGEVTDWYLPRLCVRLGALPPLPSPELQP